MLKDALDACSLNCMAKSLCGHRFTRFVIGSGCLSAKLCTASSCKDDLVCLLLVKQ